MLNKVVGSLIGLVVLGNGFVAAAIAQPAPDVSSQNSNQPMLAQAATPRSLPTLIARRVQQDLSKRLNVPLDTLEIKAAAEQTWPDQCLGIRYSRTENCGIHDVEGWQITVGSAQQTWEYRSDRTARRLRLAPLAKATDSATAHFSTSTSQKLLATVSEQLQQPTDELSILAVRSIEREICSASDVSTTSESCQTEIAPGFQVIVAEGSREWPIIKVEEYGGELVPGDQVVELVETGPKEWVYELDEDGERIVQNAIASDVVGKVNTYFASGRRAKALSESLQEDPEIVFQSVYEFSDRDIMTLTADGSVFFEKESYNPENSIEKELLYTVTPQKVAEFEALLQQQQFTNFDGLSYANADRGFAAHGFFTLVSKDASVSMNASERHLPDSLQPIVEAWTFLYRD